MSHREDPPISSPADHPDLERVAAFVEGRLTGSERQQVIRHLADCDECQALVVETVELLRPEVGIETAEEVEPPETRILRPTASIWRRRLAWMAAAAAASVAALLIGAPFLLRDGLTRPVAVADLVEPLGSTTPALASQLEEVPHHPGWIGYLGESAVSTDGQELAFRLGVRMAELGAVLATLEEGRTDRRSVARQLVFRIDGDLAAAGPGAAPANDPLVRLPFQEMARAIHEGAPPDRLRTLHDRADALLGPDPQRGTPGFVSPPYYLLGKWAGAARLAAGTGLSSWFDAPSPRRLFRALLKGDWPQALTAVLLRIDAAVGAGDIQAVEDNLRILIALAGGPVSPSEVR